MKERDAAVARFNFSDQETQDALRFGIKQALFAAVAHQYGRSTSPGRIPYLYASPYNLPQAILYKDIGAQDFLEAGSFRVSFAPAIGGPVL